MYVNASLSQAPYITFIKIISTPAFRKTKSQRPCVQSLIT
jgi:hypothetical protein